MWRKIVAAQGKNETGCTVCFYEDWALKFYLLVNRKQNNNRNKIPEVNDFWRHILKRLGCVMRSFFVLGAAQRCTARDQIVKGTAIRNSTKG